MLDNGGRRLIAVRLRRGRIREIPGLRIGAVCFGKFLDLYVERDDVLVRKRKRHAADFIHDLCDTGDIRAQVIDDRYLVGILEGLHEQRAAAVGGRISETPDAVARDLRVEIGPERIKADLLCVRVDRGKDDAVSAAVESVFLPVKDDQKHVFDIAGCHRQNVRIFAGSRCVGFDRLRLRCRKRLPALRGQKLLRVQVLRNLPVGDVGCLLIEAVDVEIECARRRGDENHRCAEELYKTVLFLPGGLLLFGRGFFLRLLSVRFILFGLPGSSGLLGFRALSHLFLGGGGQRLLGLKVVERVLHLFRDRDLALLLRLVRDVDHDR